MKKILEKVLIGLFILSINLFAVEISTNNLNLKIESSKRWKGYIYSNGLVILNKNNLSGEDIDKNYWQNILDGDIWKNLTIEDLLGDFRINSDYFLTNNQKEKIWYTLDDDLVNIVYKFQNSYTSKEAKLVFTYNDVPFYPMAKDVQINIYGENGLIFFLFSTRINLLNYGHKALDLDYTYSIRYIDFSENNEIKYEGVDAVIYFANELHRLIENAKN